VTIDAKGDTIYWKAGGRTMQAPWRPILDAARERALVREASPALY
jgi:hypothetical protein